VCCCLICWIFCGSGFFTAAAFVEAAVLWETEGAALAAGLVAGAVVAAAAGAVLAVVAAGGVVLAGVVAAGLVVAGLVVAGVVAAGLAAVFDVSFVLGDAAAGALGEAFAFASAAFEFLLFRGDFCFVASGVTLVVAGGAA
jgi:hypothetical protein